MGPIEVKSAKESIGMSEKPFYVDQTSTLSFIKNPNLHVKFRYPSLNLTFDLSFNSFHFLRQLLVVASHEILQALAKYIPQMIVGSADLSSSDGTFLRNHDFISKNHFEGRNIKYGVREFAMGCIAAGISQTKRVLPIIGDFLAFADYMKSAMRMTCLMRLKYIYHLTHDSIFVGHDGPTHQPIEQLSSLRAIPGCLSLGSRQL